MSKSNPGGKSGYINKIDESNYINGSNRSGNSRSKRNCRGLGCVSKSNRAIIAERVVDTKRRLGELESAARKAVETKRKKGILKSAAAKAVATKRKKGELKSAAAKAVATKRKLGELRTAAMKAVETK